jgi:trimethylamine:corrinoid methyltransferase-like protein
MREGHSLIADHTRRWFRSEVSFPGPVIDRANRARFAEDGATSLAQRARDRIASILKSAPRAIDEERRGRLDEIMARAARSAGMDRLPAHEI